MKLTYIISALLCTTGLSAQVLHVDSIREIRLSHPIEKIELAPSGNYLLLSNYNYQGITKVDLATKTEQVVTQAAGAGYRTKVLENGDIVYREVTNAPLHTTAIKRYIASTGKSTTILHSTRDNVLPSSAIKGDNVVTNNDFHLQLTIGGVKRTLAPLGNDKRYIWPSISPNGKKLLFFVSGQGAYVSDLNGENIIELGTLRAAKWYNNHIVVGQRDEDNGEVTTSSQIIAKNITTGIEQILTERNVIAMYPSVSSQGDKILFSTPEGKAFMIHINNKE
jgi:hypothetical protein